MCHLCANSAESTGTGRHSTASHREPSLAEQYDQLLSNVLGTSLKADNLLWEAFSNIRNARNSFVHEGQAKIGTTIVDVSKAGDLVVKAGDIVEFVRLRLPEELQWPVYTREITMQLASPMLPPSPLTEE